MVSHDQSSEYAQSRNVAMTHVFREGGKAAAVTAVVVGIAHFAAEKYWPVYRKQSVSGKWFWITSAVVAALVIRGEQALIQHSSDVNDEIAAKMEREDRVRAGLPPTTSPAVAAVHTPAGSASAGGKLA